MSTQVAKVDEAGLPALPPDVSPMLVMIERAKDVLSYDEETGRLCWRVSRGRLAKAGDVAGTVMAGRRYVKIDGKFYLAHRLIYAIKTGAFPEHEIDHIDGNADNNAWSNLRPCTHAENQQNRGVSKRSQSGLLGVSPHGDAWQASIRSNGKQVYLGRFSDKNAAYDAYLQAKRKLHTFSPEAR